MTPETVLPHLPRHAPTADTAFSPVVNYDEPPEKQSTPPLQPPENLSLGHPEKSTPTPKKRSKADIKQLMRKTLKAFHNNRINVLIGDITRLNDIHELPVESIICPYGEPLVNFSAVRRDILTKEPSLQDSRLHHRLNKLQVNTAGISRAVNLKAQGMTHIIHQIMPRADGGNASVQLCHSYISAIEQARKKGLKSIAVPVLNPGIPDDLACEIALTAVLHCQNNPDTGDNAPEVFFVFPNDRNNRNMYRAMDAELRAIEETANQSDTSTGIEEDLTVTMNSEDTLELLDEILPKRPGLRPTLMVRKKTEWIDSEIHKVCKLMSQGNCPLHRSERIRDYIEKAYGRMQDMALDDKLSKTQFIGLKEYLDQRLRMLEIFTRKQDRIHARQRAYRRASDNCGDSVFFQCPVSVKLSMMNDFDSYSCPAFQKHYLKPVPSAGSDFSQVPPGEIHRPFHGVQSSARTAVWVKALIHLYQKHGDEQAASIREEDIPLIQMAAIYEASARKHNNQHLWEHKSAEACQGALMEAGVDLSTAERIAQSITGKNRFLDNNKSILEKILHDAVLLDSMRMGDTFNLQELDFTRQFKDQTLANSDARKLANEVRSAIHRQHDLVRSVRLHDDRQNIAERSIEPSFDIEKKKEWEFSPEPYTAIEEDIEANSPFVACLLIDEMAL